jgi:predicted lipoprotein with Yx(FWY)xxD motif
MSDRIGRRVPVIGAFVVTTVLLAACSSAATSAPTAQVLPATAAPPSVAAPAASAATTGDTYTVSMATDPKLGKFLTGEDGKTLYTFRKDTANTSNCSGGCATAWPPLAVPAGTTPTAGPGVKGTLGVIQRADGTSQVTLDGKPLYYYSKDVKPGDATGQGFNGLWYVVQVATSQ